MRVLLAAEEAAGIQAVRAACQSGHDVVAVMTGSAPRKKAGPAATVEGVARHFDLPVWPAERVRDPAFSEVVKKESVDLLLNVHSLHVVHEAMLGAVRYGAFNLHPGPLPRYAGMNAPSWAILNGETRHAVTLHWMEAGIDTGPVAWESPFDLAPDDTGLSVSSRCTRLGLELIGKLLQTVPDEIPRIPQDHSARRYHGYEKPFTGRLPWESAARIERLVRASNFHPLPSPWGVPSFTHEGETIGLIEVALTRRPCIEPPGTVRVRDGCACLATGDEWLELRRLIRRGKPLRGGDLDHRTDC